MPKHAYVAPRELNKQINVRVSEEDYRLLEAIAKSRGMFLSDVVRHFVTSALHPRLPT